MTYQEATTYLFNVAPLFQNIGSGAYKEGLENTHALDAHFGHPHKSFKTIHVAGTNGKGSCSHTIAAILQKAGYKVGLYTSPHLIDFRERIKVNGEMIPEQRVIDFVEQERDFFEPLFPSFFELTTALAFKYFQEMEVDVAVIEVGLGGRLDCTNIITPELSVITNISFDHTQFLGNTLPLIAAEKAGIIKENVPVVIGETGGNKEVKEVFLNKWEENGCKQPIVFADVTDVITSCELNKNGGIDYQTTVCGNLHGELGGFCQTKNTATIINAVLQLQNRGFVISEEHIKEGFANVCELTGLMGRWQKIADLPLTICDTGHNVGGIQYISQQIERQDCAKKHLVIGMVGDKDVKGSLSLLPQNAVYYFTQATVKRAMPAEQIASLGKELGMEGSCYPTVREAYEAAKNNATKDDMIYIGGSSFIVADFLTYLQKH